MLQGSNNCPTSVPRSFLRECCRTSKQSSDGQRLLCSTHTASLTWKCSPLMLAWNGRAKVVPVVHVHTCSKPGQCRSRLSAAWTGQLSIDLGCTWESVAMQQTWGCVGALEYVSRFSALVFHCSHQPSVAPASRPGCRLLCVFSNKLQLSSGWWCCCRLPPHLARRSWLVSCPARSEGAAGLWRKCANRSRGWDGFLSRNQPLQVPTVFLNVEVQVCW